MGAPLPPVIPEPFANAAPTGTSPGNKTAPIPDTVSDSSLASWSLGWQPITMQPVAAGGKPPRGQDINGVLFAVTSHNYFTQAGQLFPYLSAVATAIGGYAVGTVLGSADGSTVWFNTAANNMTDPDNISTAAGWVSLYTYGFLTLAVSGGSYALTQQQAARKVIVLTGVLAANVAIIVPNTIGGRWLVINNTTAGSFSVTVRTAAGAGVNVPAGGFSNPLEVYGDGTNIYPTVAPLGVPISQAATPLTLAERTNAGYLLATYFNQSSPSAENPAVGSVFVESGGDGYLRKATLAYLESVMALQSIGGQIQPSQIVTAAVTQFAPNILASAVLTGTPTAPTPAPGTNNTQVATAAFVAGLASLAGSNGPGTQSSFTLPNGVTVKFGQTGFFGGSTSTVTFTNPFGTLGYVAFVAAVNSSNQVYPTAAPGTGGFTIAGGSGGITCLWIAVGK